MTSSLLDLDFNTCCVELVTSVTRECVENKTKHPFDKLLVLICKSDS